MFPAQTSTTSRKLGASQAFDYNSKTVVADISRALQDKTVAGALAIGLGSGEACLDIIPQMQRQEIRLARQRPHRL